MVFGALMVTLTPGTRLYKYDLIRRVGNGYFGAVWLATDTTVDRQVAVKILDESMAPAASVLEEARVGNKLEHSNVVKIHYADVVDHAGENLVIIAMEYLPRGSVQSLLNGAGFIPSPRAIAITIDVLKGLEYLHEQRILHNDIKPSNILLGNDGHYLLTDYGISCVVHGASPVPAPASYILHRAPETGTTNKISSRSDIYQVGMTLFRLSNGTDILDQRRQALGHGQFEAMKASGNMPSDADYGDFVDPRIKRVIQNATMPNPSDRYLSALQMRRALERIVVQGYWDVDQNGRYIGSAGHNRYSYDETSQGRTHSLIAFKQNVNSGLKRRLTAHCHASLSANELSKMKRKFMRAVVKGDV
jgi:eukaryotic-like serine/threonine-protein kinase